MKAATSSKAERFSATKEWDVSHLVLGFHPLHPGAVGGIGQHPRQQVHYQGDPVPLVATDGQQDPLEGLFGIRGGHPVHVQGPALGDRLSLLLEDADLAGGDHAVGHVQHHR